MRKLSVRDITVAGKRVFVRVDFNVPLGPNGEITDDTRIRAALPTIRWLMEQGARTVVLGSHLGKAKGSPDPRFSLKPVALRLEELLGQKVVFAPDCIGPAVVRLVQETLPGSVVMLENLRFHPGEEKNDPVFAKSLAALVDQYVNDAFGTAHRAHASTAKMAEFFSQPAAGLLMEREINYLGKVLESPERPFVVIIGGAKISDKAGVIKNLLPRVDKLLLGGGVAFNFLKAQGIGIGRSLWEPELLPEAAKLAGEKKLVLPVDVRVAAGADAETGTVVGVRQIPEEMMGLDIGDQTSKLYAEIIGGARTVVWAGPMGVFERPAFRAGTVAIARALAEATERGALTVVGGGDTVAAVSLAGVERKIRHISTGGGATLEFLEGKVLPGIAALEDAR